VTIITTASCIALATHNLYGKIRPVEIPKTHHYKIRFSLITSSEITVQGRNSPTPGAPGHDNTGRTSDFLASSAQTLRHFMQDPATGRTTINIEIQARRKVPEGE
jgi:hypothetical protein